VGVERVLRFGWGEGGWVHQEGDGDGDDDGDDDHDGDGDGDDYGTHHRIFVLRAILVHLGGARYVV
jgi:hypothetical protein